MEKKELRKLILEKNRQHNVTDKEMASEEVLKKLVLHKRIQDANTVVLFWSMKDEIDTHKIVAELVRKKNIILITQSADIKPVTPPDDAVIIVPAMAYDKEGHRLGKGKGYYDRYLSLLEKNYKIGICFPWQITENIPLDSHDMCVDEVIY